MLQPGQAELTVVEVSGTFKKHSSHHLLCDAAHWQTLKQALEVLRYAVDSMHRHGACRMFIGQGAGSKKGGGGGMKQAEQKKVLADFRAGLYNTMVATCIGEEGLDIPQVRHCTAFQNIELAA